MKFKLLWIKISSTSKYSKLETIEESSVDSHVTTSIYRGNRARGR